MRKRVLVLLTLLFVCVSVGVYAVEDIQSSLVQGSTAGLKAGAPYTMELKLALPGGYRSTYKSFTLSFLMDRSLSYKKSSVTASADKSAYRVMHSSTESGREIVTLVIDDVGKLKGPNVSLTIDTVIKSGVKDLPAVTNTYVMSTISSAGKAQTVQKTVKSDENAAPAPAPTPAPGGTESVEPVMVGENTLKGKAAPGTKIQVFRGNTRIGAGAADSKGNFAIVINPQPEGAKLEFRFATSGGEKKIAVVVGAAEGTGETSPAHKELADFLRVLEGANRDNLDEVQKLQIDAGIARARYTLAKSDVPDSELKAVLGDVKGALAVARPAYVTGYPNNTFGPRKPMTRGEVAAVFTKILNHGKPASGFSSFKDVDEGKWYAASVGFMEKRGIIGGYSDGSFKPNKSITRAEFAKILAGYAGLTPGGSARFSDVKGGHWAEGYIAAVADRGYMSGRREGKFDPTAEITRQEVVTAMNKAMQRTPDKAFLDTYAKNPFSDVKSNAWSYYQILEATGQPTK